MKSNRLQTELHPDSESKRTQTLFLQAFKIKVVTTFVIQTSRSEYSWYILIRILFGVFKYQNL